MKSIRWGIIGCGDVTEIKSGPAFSKVYGSSLQAVMRRDGGKAQDYARRHNVPTWYDDAAKLISDPDVDAIYIATPPSSHLEYAIAAMQAGKPVYIEKPMTLDAAEAEKIAEAASFYKIKTCIAHYRRQLPFFLKIKSLLDEGAIGKIRVVDIRMFQRLQLQKFKEGDFNWRIDPALSGGGYFHDLAPHQLDLMYYFFGMPEEITGTSHNQAGHYPADDVVTARIKFANDIIMNGLWCFTVPDYKEEDRCDIIGTGGSLSFSFFTMDKLLVNRNGKEEEILFEPVAHVQQPMIGKIVSYFAGEGTNPCSPEDGIVVMKMLDEVTKK